MIVLNASTDSLVMTLGGANSHSYHVSYLALAPGQNMAEGTPGGEQGAHATTAEKTLVSAPTSGKRVITGIFVRNGTANTTTCTLAIDVSGTNRDITPAISLASGESFYWCPENGLTMYQSTGLVRTS